MYSQVEKSLFVIMSRLVLLRMRNVFRQEL